jgi:hypothetical protein
LWHNMYEAYMLIGIDAAVGISRPGRAVKRWPDFVGGA